MEQKPDKARDIRIAAERAAVWAALGDGQVLKRCIAGNSERSEIDPPDSCVLSLDVEGGVESRKGVVSVQLSDDGGSTRVTYSVADSADQKMADDFFTTFASIVGEGGSAATLEEDAGGYQPSQQGVIWAIMFGVLILAVVLTL